MRRATGTGIRPRPRLGLRAAGVRERLPVAAPAGAQRGAYGGYGAPRSGTKTFFIAGLLSLIPFVGVGMAAIYYCTRQQPNAFDGGKAAGASFVAGLAALVVVGIIYAAVFAGIMAIAQA